jgi:LacI family transcriptional regulator
MNIQRISLKTIADEAGVSVSTVSQILNNKPNNFSSERTKQKIRQIANDIGYRPNFGYRLMRGEKTKTVSIILGEAFGRMEIHIQKIIIEIMAEFDRKGYACYLSAFTFDSNENLVKIRELIARGSQYFVLLGTPYGHEQIEDEIIKNGKNYIGYSSSFKRTVNPDSTTGAEAILRYFISEGKNNFRLLISRDKNISLISDTRFAALRRIFPDKAEDVLLNKYVIQIDMHRLINENMFVDIGYSATAEAFAKDPDIQAIFYHVDYFALGGSRYFLENGITIGKDVLVAGFNNTMAVKFYPFPISSVEHDIKRISNILMEESFNDQPLNLIIDPIVHIRK